MNRKIFFILSIFFLRLIVPSRADEYSDLGIKLLSSETIPDKVLEKTLLTILPGYAVPEGTEPIHYYYNKVDLNGDSKPELFVYLAGSWTCGSGGCNAVVLTQTKTGYKVITEFTVANTPVLVARTRTKGWNDLIFPVSGGGAKSGYSIVRFNGKKYPGNPTTQPAIKLTKGIAELGLCSNVAPGGGIPFAPVP